MAGESGYRHVSLKTTDHPHAPAGEQSPEEVFAAERDQPLVALADLVDTARRVRGVYACHIERADGARLPARVRVVAHVARRLAVAKDVQSAWFTLWNLYVPRTRFLVTAVRSPVDVQRRDRRLQLCRLSLRREADHLTAATALFCGGRIYEGEASGLGGDADPCRLAAQATVQALAEALAPEGRPELVDVRIIPLAGRRAAVCALSWRGNLLYGVCEVRATERDAAARAVLNAANRLVPS